MDQMERSLEYLGEVLTNMDERILQDASLLSLRQKY